MGNPIAPRTERRRPAPVTILAVIQIIGATGYLLSIATVTGADLKFFTALAERGLQILSDETVSTITVATTLVVMAAIGYTGAILLLRMERLGWTIVMLLTGWSLASQIYLYATGGSVTPTMLLLGAVTVLYLNQRQVRMAFDIGRPEGTSIPELDERA